MLYFWKAQGPRTSKLIFPTVKYTNTNSQIHGEEHRGIGYSSSWISTVDALSRGAFRGPTHPIPLRDVSSYQNGWTFGKVPMGSDKNHNVYPEAFKPVSFSMWLVEVCGTSRPLGDHLVTTSRPHCDHLLTTLWPLGGYLVTTDVRLRIS